MRNLRSASAFSAARTSAAFSSTHWANHGGTIATVGVPRFVTYVMGSSPSSKRAAEAVRLIDPSRLYTSAGAMLSVVTLGSMVMRGFYGFLQDTLTCPDSQGKLVKLIKILAIIQE